MTFVDPFSKMDLEGRAFPVKPITTFEGWRGFVRTSPPPKPVMPSVSTFGTMSRDERKAFDSIRREYHAKCAPIETPMFKEALKGSLKLAAQGFRMSAGVRPGVILDGLGTSGKSTIASELGRQYEISLRRSAGIVENLPNGSLFCPVVYLTLPGEITVKGFMKLIAIFLGIPGATGTHDLSWYDERVTLYCMDVGVSLIIIDDIHFLQMKNRGAIGVNNHIKYLASSISATFVYAGIHVAGTGILTEGNGKDRASISQTDNRFKKYDIKPFEKGSAEFASLLLSFEDNVCLIRKEARSILKLADYIHDRTNGFLGSVSQLFREAAGLAIQTGEEQLSKKVFDMVRLSHRSEEHHRVVVRSQAKPAPRVAKSTSAPTNLPKVGTGAVIPFPGQRKNEAADPNSAGQVDAPSATTNNKSSEPTSGGAGPSDVPFDNAKGLHEGEADATEE